MAITDIGKLFYNYLITAKRTWLCLVLITTSFKAPSQGVHINDSVALFNSIHNSGNILEYTYFQPAFFKPAGGRINLGLAGSRYKYILLKLISNRNLQDYFLSIDNTSLDTVSIYKLIHDGTRQLIYQGGSLVAFDSKRNYVWHTAGVELKSEPSYYLIALKAAQKNINLGYEILHRNALHKKYQANDRLVFFYSGTVCMISAMTLVAFFLYRKTVFAVYLCYTLCVAGWILSHYDRIFPYVYPQVPVLNEIVKPLTSLGASGFLVIVLQSVFRQQLQSRRWLEQLLSCTLYALLLLICLMFLLLIQGLHPSLKFGLILGWHVGLVISIPIIVFTPLYFFRSGVTARIFSLALLIISVMAAIQLFNNLNQTGNYIINEHGMTIGSLLEITVMAYGLFHSLLRDIRHKTQQVLALKYEQTETLKKLITVQDNERKRIAADLHDNIGPLLAALKINFRRIVQAKEEDGRIALVAKTESIIDDSIAEIRNIAHNLMPKGLSSNGLINTLTDHFAGLQQLYNKTIVFQHGIQSILNLELQLNVYLVICELVLNASRHSQARLISVTLFADGQKITIGINDDGQGFSLKPVHQKKSLGLRSAESRVAYLKGKFSLQTNAGEGTAIAIQIPLEFDEAKVERF